MRRMMWRATSARPDHRMPGKPARRVPTREAAPLVRVGQILHATLSTQILKIHVMR